MSAPAGSRGRRVSGDRRTSWRACQHSNSLHTSFRPSPSSSPGTTSGASKPCPSVTYACVGGCVQPGARLLCARPNRRTRRRCRWRPSRVTERLMWVTGLPAETWSVPDSQNGSKPGLLHPARQGPPSRPPFSDEPPSRPRAGQPQSGCDMTPPNSCVFGKLAEPSTSSPRPRANRHRR